MIGKRIVLRWRMEIRGVRVMLVGVEAEVEKIGCQFRRSGGAGD